MNIFITGASGYIGGTLAEALVAAGNSVSGLARSEETARALSQRGIAPIAGTRARGELVEAVFDEDTPFTPTPPEPMCLATPD